jgi:DNA-binding response OmpR family regulator
MLVVADEPAIVGPAGLVFRALGYDIQVAKDAGRALELVADRVPDVALCDAELTGVSKLTQDLRIVDGGHQIAIILTGYGTEPAGNAADGFVPRPFDPIKVVELIDAATRT